LSRTLFSPKAVSDLRSIASYTLETWGEVQADRYIDDLESQCRTLANSPQLGRICSEIRPGLRRFEHRKHVIFFRESADGILVSRILHERMAPQRHNFAEGT
jgi:toxin ParE1/3/4